MTIHAGHIEVAVAHLLNFRRNTIVPNISYGLYVLNHECDMLVLDDRNRVECLWLNQRASSDLLKLFA